MQFGICNRNHFRGVSTDVRPSFGREARSFPVQVAVEGSADPGSLSLLRNYLRAAEYEHFLNLMLEFADLDDDML